MGRFIFSAPLSHPILWPPPPLPYHDKLSSRWLRRFCRDARWMNSLIHVSATVGFSQSVNDEPRLTFFNFFFFNTDECNTCGRISRSSTSGPFLENNIRQPIIAIVIGMLEISGLRVGYEKTPIDCSCRFSRRRFTAHLCNANKHSSPRPPSTRLPSVSRFCHERFHLVKAHYNRSSMFHYGFSFSRYIPFSERSPTTIFWVFRY